MSATFEKVIAGLLEKAETTLGPKVTQGFSELADTWIHRGSTSVSELGPKGQMIVEGLRNFTEKHRMMFGEYTAARDKLSRQVIKTSPEVLKNYEEYFTGAQKAPSKEVQELIDFDKMTNIGAYQRATKSGIKTGPPNPDNWSRIWPRGSFEGVNRAESLKHLIDTGQVKTEAEGEKLLDLLAQKSKGVKAHSLTSGRVVNLPGYRKDIAAPSDSMDQKLKHIAFHETFGNNGEILNELLSQVKKERGNSAYQLADKYVDVLMKKTGVNYRPYSNAEQTIASVTAARFLGLVPIKHPGKVVNAAIFANRLGPIVKSVKSMVDDYDNASEFAIRSGAVLSKTLDSIRTTFDGELGRGSSLIPQLRVINMEERIGRTFSAIVGKELAKDLVAEFAETKSSLAKTKLIQLGIDAEKAVKEGLTEKDLLLAAQRTSDITQFRYTVDQLPIAWRSSPTGRLLTQYKPFIYLQSRFLRDEVIKPAITSIKTGGREGTMKPLAYASILLPTVGEIIGDLSNLATRGDLKDRPEGKYWLDRVIDNLTYVGGFGVLHDLAFALSSPDRVASIPILSFITDILRIPLSKHPGKEALRQVPIVGPLASRKMYPQKQGPKSWLQRGETTRRLYGLFGGKP